MEFAARMSDVAEAIEVRLAHHLDGATANAPSRLADAMAYAVLGGGKRFRPFLVAETASLFNVPQAGALDVGVAVELIHGYSLVHDDLPAMDDDELRRGKPTVHLAFDEATAILAGDALQTLAFEVLAGLATERQTETSSQGRVQPMVACELVRALAVGSGWAGMAGGQMLDLEAEQDPSESAGQIERIQRLKTGALIRFSCEAGAILGGATPDQRARVVTYAEALGLAFQISDDLLDVEGTPEAVGKATGKDADAGKATFVSLLGVGGARAKLRDLEAEAATALAPFGGKAETLLAAMHYMTERRS